MSVQSKTEKLEEIALRKLYKKDSYAKLLLVIGLLLSMITVLLLVFGYIITHPPQSKYFATSINGRITPLIPMDEPNQSDAAVLQWANQAAIQAYTYNFVNYAQELNAASSYFTSDGWQQFLAALQSSNVLDMVKSKKLVVSAVATRAPVILQKGVVYDRYSWRVQFPMLVTYQSASEYNQEQVVITMLITRISTLESPRGIGISQFISSSSSGGEV
jgi:intracellular multiplication protein IcmL